MPTVSQIFTLDVTPEKFLKACSMNELQELDLLIGPELRRRQQSAATNQLDSKDFEEEF